MWDRTLIQEGERFLEEAMELRSPGPYQIQAAIAALHCQASSPAQTDWPQIAALYGRLYQLNPTPVIALNRIAALAMADGPTLGLRLLDQLEQEANLENYRWLHAARADLLRRAGRLEEAIPVYRKTLEMTRNEMERAFLERRLREVESSG